MSQIREKLGSISTFQSLTNDRYTIDVLTKEAGRVNWEGANKLEKNCKKMETGDN